MTYFGPMEDVSFGIPGNNFDYDAFKLWIERQQLNFTKSISIGGDLVSANWDGARPPALSAVDSAATVGFAFDSSEGASQLMGNMFLGGDLTLLSGGLFKTAASGDRIEIGGSQAFISLYDAVEGLVGQIGWAASGFGTNDLTIENQSGLGNIELHAAGIIELNAAGSAGFGVMITDVTPAGGSPGKPFYVAAATGNTGFGFVVIDQTGADSPTWAFALDQDTGISRPATNQLGIVAAGENQAYWTDGGSGSAMFLRDGLTDVGNHETLRLDRGTGTTMKAVGYFSSWAEGKSDIVPLLESPRFPGLDIIDKLGAVDFERKSTKQREWGFLLDQFKETDDNLRYLTTKGDEWGYSPDEFAINAVLWEAVKDLRGRVSVLEGVN